MTPGKAYLTPDEIRRLATRSDWVGLWLLLHCWAVIAAALALFAWLPNVLTFLLAVMVIGSRQLGLAILMHEAAHNALFRTLKFNNFAGEWLCARPIMAELATYRQYHLSHHRFTQTEKDPDLVLSEKFPTSRASLRRKFLRDLTGQTGLKQLAGQLLAARSDADLAQAFKARRFLRSVPVFVGITLAISLIGEWWWGLAFWVLPYLTWFQLVLRIRNIAEHGATEQSDNPLQNVRTTRAGPVMRLFVAPYWVNYHLEHHLVMHVPCWQLPRMHALLTQKGLAPQMRIAKSYGAALSEAGWRNA